MKKLLFVLAVVLLTVSCGKPEIKKVNWERAGFYSYNEYVIDQFNNLKRPIVLTGVVNNDRFKRCDNSMFTSIEAANAITIKDGKDSIICFSDCDMVRVIASTFKVGDVIIK